MRCAQKNPAYHTIYGVSRAIVHKSDIRVTFKCNALVGKLTPKDVPSDSAQRTNSEPPLTVTDVAERRTTPAKVFPTSSSLLLLPLHKHDDSDGGANHQKNGENFFHPVAFSVDFSWCSHYHFFVALLRVDLKTDHHLTVYTIRRLLLRRKYVVIKKYPYIKIVT